MRFEPSFLNELKQRLRASEIIGEYVNLRHKAGGEFLGLCPFHKENTPSFTVSDTKGFYHCFGCGAHGDPIKFVMDVDHLPYVDAIKLLAEKVSLALPAPPKLIIQKPYEVSLYDIMEKASEYYQHCLNSPMGEEARAYLQKRSLEQDIIHHFRIGYAPPQSDGILQYLKQHFPKVTIQDLVTSGLCIQNERGEVYGRFRNRIMFPIIDSSGRVIAFGGRALGDFKPKYLNSPETPLFKKREVLYFAPGMQQAAYKQNNVIVTEGYMDVIALYRSGLANTVAPLGTSITLNHLHMLWKMSPIPTVCMDGDEAGKRSMLRLIETALPELKPGYSVRFASLPLGKDPDDIIREQGIDFLRQRLDNATLLSEALWNSEYAMNKAESPEALTLLEHTLEMKGKQIQDDKVRYNYLNYFRRKVREVSYNLNNYKRSSKAGRVNEAQPLTENILSPVSSDYDHEIALILAVMNHPEILDDHEIYDDFAHISFNSPPCIEIQTEIMNLYLDNLHHDIKTKENMITYLESKGLNHYISKIESSNSVALYQRSSEMELKDWWKQMLNFYNLSSLMVEHKEAVEQLAKRFDEVSYNRLTQITKDMEHLKTILEIQD